ncbi:carboxymuconolactone decarboxylase family protein [Rhodanobacter sp. B2A1Ga4]|nr:carboxymuconolactone decarboxylase family protein [Rhodanobacter sp. B2A1Ga4]
MTSTSRTSETLSTRQQAIVPIAAFAAAGDMTKLDIVLNEGLDAGLTISDVREVLLQLYAYAGFPRSLNALGELMKVVASRKEKGIDDALGQAPGHGIPTGEALLAAGTANQTKLSGGPVKGALFDFAPTAQRWHEMGVKHEGDQIDQQLRKHAGELQHRGIGQPVFDAARTPPDGHRREKGQHEKKQAEEDRSHGRTRLQQILRLLDQVIHASP